VSAAEEERAALHRANAAARAEFQQERAVALAGDPVARAGVDEAFAAVVAANAEARLGPVPFEAPPPVPRRYLLPPGVAPPAWWSQRHSTI